MPQDFSKTAIILGAGPTGLSTGWQLIRRGWQVIILEKEAYIGGISATTRVKNYFVDNGPHKLYPQIPRAESIIKYLVGGALQKIPKKSKIYLKGKYIPYPFGLVDLVKGLGIVVGIRAGVSFVFGKIASFFKHKKRTYTDFAIAHFGRFACDLVFRPMSLKLWGDPDNLDVQLAKTRIIAPKVIDLIASLFRPFKNKPQLSADVFYYPEQGIGTLWEAMARDIEQSGGKIIRETTVASICQNLGENLFEVSCATGSNQETINGRALISTIPLKITFNLWRPTLSSKIANAVEKLRLNSLLVLYLVIDTQRVLDSNWIFVPEGQYLFNRVSEQKGFSEKMIPPDCSVLMVEVPLAREQVRQRDQEAIMGEAIEQLRAMNILKPQNKVLDYFFKYNDSIYPVYDLNYQKNLNVILDWSDSVANFYLNGRLGLFCYNNMDHSIEMGVKLADHIANGGELNAWRSIRDTFYEYRIVD